MKKGNAIKVHTYAIMVRCVEEGVAYGWNHAHKHTDTPDPDTIKNEIEAAVINSICEYFSFEEDADA